MNLKRQLKVHFTETEVTQVMLTYEYILHYFIVLQMST